MTARAVWTLTAALAVSAPAGDAKKDEDQLQGTWKVVSVERNGKKTPARDTARLKVVVAGDKVTALDDNEVTDEYAFRLDPAARPRTIDLTRTSGKEKGKVTRGIYSFEGDRLTVCSGEPDKDRPKAFAAPEGTDQTLFVFERARP
jgi:uncharacterized protein (TIGR03067 family)